MIKKVILVVSVIFSVISSMLGSAYLLLFVLGLPPNLLFPLPIRLIGIFVVAVGFGFLGWTLIYRKPVEVMESTYVTIVKAIKRLKVEKNLGRTEPLVILGPYKYVRNPQYFGACLLLIGWWLLLDYTFLFLFLWFRFVLIPFEEKELVAIFGEQYKDYMRQVPSIIPFTNIFRG